MHRASSAADHPLELRRLAIDLARQAGTLALTGRRQAADADSLGTITKSTSTDMVTEFDRAAEALIVAALRSARPDDAIIGEEGTADAGQSEYSWFIDPIDGTTSYVYDLPTWSCSIAVARGATVVAGAVYLPVLDEMFDAALGHGATLNCLPITCSTLDQLQLALVGTGFSYVAEARVDHAEQVARMIGHIRDIRRMGSAAVDLCFVAAGRLDVYFERNLNMWDAAAGALIAHEAGAITSDFSGGPMRPAELLCAAPGVHAEFVSLLADSLAS